MGPGLLRVGLVVGLAGAAACAETAGRPPARDLGVHLVSTGEAPGAAAVDVVGVPGDVLAALEAAALEPAEWTAWLRVSVRPRQEPDDVWDHPAVLGA